MTRSTHPPGGDDDDGEGAFARRPIWIVGHIVALAAVAAFVLLGMWQLRRHDERMLLDDRVETRLAAAARPLDELIRAFGDDPDELELRRAVATGRYLIDDEVILQARTLRGRSGHEVLTPLLLDDGTAVLVDRGWVPIDVAGPPVVGAEPPEGNVAATGYLRATEMRRGLGPVDPPEGRLDRVSRVDIGRLQQQVGPGLLGVYLVLEEQAPPQPDDLPVPIPAPEPGGGPPHLSYAIQWFAFAGVVAVGYPVLLVRTARRGSELPRRG